MSTIQRNSWITYFVILCILSPLNGYLSSISPLQYIAACMFSSYAVFALTTFLCFRAITNLSSAKTLVRIAVYSASGAALVVLVNTTILSKNFGFFWSVTLTMITLGLANAVGMLSTMKDEKQKTV